jgi:hypothetical protein
LQFHATDKRSHIKHRNIAGAASDKLDQCSYPLTDISKGGLFSRNPFSNPYSEMAVYYSESTSSLPDFCKKGGPVIFVNCKINLQSALKADSIYRISITC